MSDILPAWHAGLAVAVGTVVGTWRSAPRPAGAAMVVLPEGEVAGSVSGGCVEGAVYQLAQQVRVDGAPVLERYGVSDVDALTVGLTCGGVLDVFIERIDRSSFPELGSVAADIEAGRPVAVATLIEHPDPSRVGQHLVVRPPGTLVDGLRASGSLGSARFDAAVTADAQGLLAAGRTSTLPYGPEGQRMEHGARVFVSSYSPPPRMIVFGAIDFAAALARTGALLGFHVTVCDARSVFTTRARFPAADQVVVDWPHRYLQAEADAGRVDARTVLAVLTHDPKFDVPVLQVALRLPDVAYIGAMGSRTTHEDRLARLSEAGLTMQDLDRLRSPIGLDLGARTPEETAVSIAAEIIALRYGGSGRPLRGIDEPIHRPEVAGSAVSGPRP